MKTHITFKKMDGSDGVALIDGDASSTPQAKRELAAFLDLPVVESEDIDQRLRRGGIDPHSIKAMHISE